MAFTMRTSSSSNSFPYTTLSTNFSGDPENELKKLWKDKIHDIKELISKQFREEMKKRGFGSNFDIGLDANGNV